MIRTLTSLATLLMAASLVNLANSALTTVMPLRMLEDGASDTAAALFGSVFFLGFALGCFTQPPLIQRIGFIRAFAAAAGICTVLAVVMDFSDSVALWMVLRFFMGIFIAAVFAAVDGWINGTALDSIRGKVFATYGWCMGASAVLSQVLLMRFDGMSIGFLTVLALSFNLGLVLVAMTSTVPPPSHAAPEDTERGLVFTSTVSVATAVYAGLITTAVLSTLPPSLAGAGVSEADIGAAIGAFFMGRLLLQIPVGIIADRVDLRLLVGVVAGLIGVTAVVTSVLIRWDAAPFSPSSASQGRWVFLAVMLCAGGLVLPLYTVANSLAFSRAKGRSGVRIATSLLLVNSAGAVAGPLLVAGLIPTIGNLALPVAVAALSAIMAALAFHDRHRDSSGTSRVGMSTVATTSVAANNSMATTAFPEADIAETDPAKT